MLACGVGLTAVAALASGPVDDPGQALDPYGPKLARRAAQWRVDLGVDVHIRVLRAEGQRLDRIARRTFDAERLGETTPNGALLLLIDTAGPRARIEVSDALAPLYPDALLADLVRHQLVPYARYDALGMGVADVLAWMKERAYAQLAQATLADRPPDGVERFGRWLAGRRERPAAEVAFADVPDDLEAKRPLSDAERARFAPSPLVTESVEAYARVLDALAGDPSLALFTPGSQVMRSRYPMAPWESWKRRDALLASRPWEIRVEGDRAVIDSARPAPGFYPLLLRRIDGTWRIDVAETYKSLFYGRDGRPVLVNRHTPYRFGLQHLGRAGGSETLAALDLGEETETEAVARLEAKLAASDAAVDHFELAEILFRNCFAAMAALHHYREAAQRAPEDAHIQRRGAERAAYLGFPRVAIPLLERVGPEGYVPLARAYLAADRYDEAERYYRLALAREPASREAQRGLAAVRRARP